MADKFINDLNGQVLKRYKDMGDGSFAEVVSVAGGGGTQADWKATGTTAEILNKPTIKSYLGQVATRCAMGSGINAAKQFFSVSSHVATDDLTAPQIVLQNWYGTGGLESTASLSDTTYTASIEYPLVAGGAAGTVTQVLFSGATSGVATVGSNLISDPVALATKIPKGARFRIRVWGNSSGSNTIICGGMTSSRQISGGPVDDIYRSGATVADQTMSAFTSAMTYPLDYRGFKPVAIIQQTCTRSVAIIGDSRGMGLNGMGDRVTDANGWIGQAERIIGQTGCGFSNLALASDSAGNFTVALAPRRTSLLQYFSDVYCEYGINDVAGGASLATIMGRIKAIKALPNVVGKQVIGCTLAPQVTVSGSNGTVAEDGSDQTVTGNEALRVSYNETLRGGASPFDGVVEVADLVESYRNSGKWKSGSATATDGVATTNSYTINSAVFTTAHIGKCCVVDAAGWGTAKLIGIVQSVVAGTSATLNVPAGRNVASGGSVNVGDIYTIDGVHETMQANLQIQNNVKVPYQFYSKF